MPPPSSTDPASVPAIARLSGTVLEGRYELGRVLGAGGMGAVFEAKQLRLDRDVAVKILRPAFMGHEEFIHRFMREAKVVSKINHRNVVEILDYGDTGDGMVFLVMKLLRGQDLERYLQGQPNRRISWSLARPLLMQVAAGLKAAHAKGIIHRDIKPGNCILVREDDETIVKLVDFGIAKIDEAEQTQKLTHTATILGTPAYIAPEIAMTQEPATASSDVYSLGALAFRMLVGREPFSGKTAFEVLHHACFSPVPALRTELPELPNEVEALILSMLAKTPTERPPDMSAVRRKLADLDRLQPSTTPSGTAVLTSDDFGGRRDSVSRIEPTALLDGPTPSTEAPTLPRVSPPERSVGSHDDVALLGTRDIRLVPTGAGRSRPPSRPPPVKTAGPPPAPHAPPSTRAASARSAPPPIQPSRPPAPRSVQKAATDRSVPPPIQPSRPPSVPPVPANATPRANAQHLAPAVPARPLPAPSYGPNSAQPPIGSRPISISNATTAPHPRTPSHAPLYIMMATAIGLVFALGAYVWAQRNSATTENAITVAQPVDAPEPPPSGTGTLADAVDVDETEATSVGQHPGESSSGLPANESTGGAPVAKPTESPRPRPKPKRKKKRATAKPAYRPSSSPSVDCILDPSKCGTGSKNKKTNNSPSGSSNPNAPDKLSTTDIKTGITAVKTLAGSCGSKHGAKPGEKVMIKFTISGATGNVTKATPMPPHAGTVLGSCVAAAAKKAKFKEFKNASMGFQYGFRM